MAKSAKHVVKFVGGEFKPRRLASGLIGFRTPLDVMVKPGETIIIDFNMACDHMLVFEKNAVEPGQNLVGRLTNVTTETLKYEVGEVVARAYPLVAFDFDIG